MLFKKYQMISFLIILITCSGCVTVPKESVELNQEVGRGIQKSRLTHINLLNKYFEIKKSQIDQWIESEFLPAYILNIKSQLKKAGKTEVLDDRQLTDLLHDIIAERDQKQAELEKTRLFVLDKADAHYGQLMSANSGVTALLQSLVNVKEATKSMSESIKTDTGGKVDLDAIDQKFTEYLKQSGTASGAARSFYEQVKQLSSK